MTRRKKILLIVGLIIIVAVPLNIVLLARVFLSSERVRRQIETAAGEQLNCGISIGDAKVGLTGMVRLDDISLLLPDRPERPFLTVQRLLIDTSPLLILSGDEGLREIEIIKPELFIDNKLIAFLTEDTRQPSEPPASVPRRIVLKSGIIELDAGLLYEDSPPITLTGFNVTLTSDSISASQFTIAAEARHLLLGTIRINGTLDLLGQTLNATVELPSVTISPQFRALLPVELHSAFDYISLNGRISPKVEINYSWHEEKPAFTHRMSITLHDCSIRLKEFPLPVTQLNGVIESDGNYLEIRRAIARYKTGTIEITRGFFDNDIADIEMLGRQLPLDQTVIDSLPREALDIVNELGLHGGEADITYRLFTRHREQRIPDHSLALNVRNVNAKYKDFPYPLSRLSGRVSWENPRFHSETPGKVEIALQASAGKAAATINGTLILPVVKDGQLLELPAEMLDPRRHDLVINVRRMDIDDQLRETVPPELLEILTALRTEGNVDAMLMFRMRHDGRMFHIASKDVIVTLNGVSVKPEEFPYPVTDITGQVEWNGRRARLIDVRGFGGTAKVSIAGEILTDVEPGDNQPLPHLIMNVENLKFDERLRQTLDPENREIWYTFWPEGSANVKVLLGIHPGGKLDIKEMIFNLLHCSIRYADFRYPIENLTGQIVVKPEKYVRLIGLRGFAQEARVQITGRMNLPPGRVTEEDDQDANRLFVIVDGLLLDAALRAALNPDLQEIWDSFMPSGQANLFCVVNPADLENPVSRVRLDLDHASARLRAFPYPLRNLTGKIIVEEEVVTLENIAGQAGSGTFRLSGFKSLKDVDADSPHNRFNLAIRDVALDGALRAALPADWVDIWLEYRPQAVISADLAMILSNDGNVAIAPGSTGLIRNGVLKGMVLPDAALNFVMDDEIIQISNFDGRYFAGQVNGNFRYMREDDTFETEINMYNVDLKQYNDRQNLWREDIRGFVSGGLTVSGVLSDIDTWKGSTSPDVQVNHGQLANIHVFTKLIISLVNLRWPGGDTLTGARFVATLEDGRIRFSEVTLTGTTVPVTGTGKLYLDGRIRMDFYTSNKRDGLLNMIPVVNLIYEMTLEHLTSRLKDLIIQVEITGTLEEPVIRAVPFRAALAPINSLLRAITGSN